MIFSRALARHPKVFNRLFCAMVAAGESSGTLDTVLDRVATQIEKETKLKRRVKGAMIYPAVVIVVRDARPHLHADVHRSGVPEGVRRAERTAADADAGHHRDVERAPWLLVHHLPDDRADHLPAPPAQADEPEGQGAGTASSSACR